MEVALSSRQGEAAPSAVAGGAASRPLMVGPVTSVSMSTRGHSHMRGLVPQDGLFGGSGTAGLATSVAPEGLLIVPSRVRSSRCRHRLDAHQRTLHAGACGSRAVGALLRERGGGERGGRAEQRARTALT